jgi:hypothetical protein
MDRRSEIGCLNLQIDSVGPDRDLREDGDEEGSECRRLCVFEGIGAGGGGLVGLELVLSH